MQMRTLILGATGFVGSYLLDRATVSDHTHTWGTDYLATVNPAHLSTTARDRLIRCDIRYREQVQHALEVSRPDLVYLLSAQSYPALSWRVPAETLETNVVGTSNVFEAMKTLGLKPRVVVACSSAQYGEVAADDIPVKESHPMRPLHPYGVSKVATELLAMQYWVNDGIPSVCARIFNTTGPRKRGDVCADLTWRAVQIERGLTPPRLRTGNLDTFRAITDVRDLVNALELLGTHGEAGQVYNISGAKAYQIRQIVELIRANTSVPFEVETDPSLLRTSDEKIIFGDASRLRAQTGWSQSVSIEKTVVDMLEYWRQHS